jgi:hypothetical protein
MGRVQLRLELNLPAALLDRAQWARLGNRLALEEANRQHALICARRPDRSDGDPDGLQCAATSDAGVGHDLLLLVDRPLHRRAQRRLQALAREGEQIGRRVAARVLEELAGRPLERVHTEPAIDQDRGGRVALQQVALEMFPGAEARFCRQSRRPVQFGRDLAWANKGEIDDVVAGLPDPRVDAGPRNRCPPSLNAKWNRATTFF